MTKVEKTSHDKQVTANIEARSSTMGDIDAFERRLETAVFPDDPDLNATVGQAVKKDLEGDPTKGVPSTTYIDESYLNRGIVKAQRAMKEHHQATVIRQQAHDRRRRKFVREREAEALDLLKSSAENEIAARPMQGREP